MNATREELVRRLEEAMTEERRARAAMNWRSTPEARDRAIIAENELYAAQGALRAYDETQWLSGAADEGIE